MHINWRTPDHNPKLQLSEALFILGMIVLYLPSFNLPFPHFWSAFILVMSFRARAGSSMYAVGGGMHGVGLQTASRETTWLFLLMPTAVQHVSAPVWSTSTDNGVRYLQVSILDMHCREWAVPHYDIYCTAAHFLVWARLLPAPPANRAGARTVPRTTFSCGCFVFL